MTQGLTYSERLTFRWGMYLFLQFMIGSLAIAFAYVFGGPQGWVLWNVLAIATTIAVVASTPRISITAAGLRVGRAQLPFNVMGTIRILSGTAQSDALRQAHRDAYLQIRPNYSTAVLVTVNDESDPHPYWHFSTKHPEQVVSILNDYTSSAASAASEANV